MQGQLRKNVPTARANLREMAYSFGYVRKAIARPMHLRHRDLARAAFPNQTLAHCQDRYPSPMGRPELWLGSSCFVVCNDKISINNSLERELAHPRSQFGKAWPIGHGASHARLSLAAKPAQLPEIQPAGALNTWQSPFFLEPSSSQHLALPPARRQTSTARPSAARAARLSRRPRGVTPSKARPSALSLALSATTSPLNSATDLIRAPGRIRDDRAIRATAARVALFVSDTPACPGRAAKDQGPCSKRS